MAPVAKRWSDLHTLCEAFDKDHKNFLYTTFAVIDEDDAVYFGQLDIPKLQITFDSTPLRSSGLPMKISSLSCQVQSNAALSPQTASAGATTSTSNDHD